MGRAGVGGDGRVVQAIVVWWGTEEALRVQLEQVKDKGINCQHLQQQRPHPVAYLVSSTVVLFPGWLPAS